MSPPTSRVFPAPEMAPAAPKTPSSQPAPAPAPPRVPDYTLLRLIGSGAYGQVWLARSITGAYRAVKVVHRASFEEERPFEREFGGILKFEPISRSHSSQVAILHVGRARDYFYYIMELADDANANSPAAEAPQELADWQQYQPRTLKSELKHRGRLPCDECLSIALSLSRALGHLHQNGLIHRDIKPSNIIFVGGVPKLADIGLVAACDAALSFVGTEGFVPPDGPGTPQADLFSLGKVLYEMCTGRDRQEFPELPGDLRSAADREAVVELNEVVLKACERDPRRRYQSAAEMHADLALLQAGKSVRRAHGLEHRLRMLFRFGLGATLAAAVIAAAWAYQQRQARIASALERESRGRLVQLHVANGVRLMRDGDFLGALVWLAEGLRLDPANPATKTHRIRLGSVLAACPELVQIVFPGGRVQSAEFNPDGAQVATATDEGVAQVWDVATGQPASPPFRHDDAIWTAQFDPAGRRLLTASSDGTARVWSLEGHPGEVLRLRHASNVWTAYFSPDGGRIVTAGAEGLARVWRASDGLPVTPPLRHDGSVVAAVFDLEGTRVVTASVDGTARVWNVITGEPLTRPLRHERGVCQAMFSPDGGQVLTASRDGTAQLWDAETGERVGLPWSHKGEVFRAQFSPNGEWVATAGYDNTARLWNRRTGQSVAAFQHLDQVRHIRFSPDSRLLATAGPDQTVQVWDCESGERLGAPLKHNGSISAVAFSPDHRRLLTAGRDRLIRVWEFNNRQRGAQRLKHAGPVRVAAFSADGELIMTGGEDRQIRFWNAASGRLALAPRQYPGAVVGGGFLRRNQLAFAYIINRDLLLLDPRTGERINRPSAGPPIGFAAVSPDGRAAIHGNLSDAVLTQAADGTVLATLNDPTGAGFWCAAFTPDGKKLVTGHGRPERPGRGFLRFWDASTGRPLGPAMEQPACVMQVAISPDGRRCVSACSDNSMAELHAQVWDMETRRPIGPPLRHHDGVLYAEFSSDQKRIVTASEDRTARVWDASTFQPVTPPLKHLKQVWCAAFSPDNLLVVTGSQDGRAQVWDATTGDPVAPPWQHEGVIWQVSFSPDGQKVLTASDDGTARVWGLPKHSAPANQLSRLAHILSGQRIDATGGVAPMETHELRELWKLRGSNTWKSGDGPGSSSSLPGPEL